MYASGPAGETSNGTTQKTDQSDETVTELKARLDKLSKDFASKLRAAEAKLAAAEQNQKRAQAEAKRLQDEVNTLGDALRKREAELARLQTEVTKSRNEALAQADLARLALMRAEKLLKQLQEKERQVVPGKDPQPARDPKASNPPPQYVKGKVLKVNPTDARMVVISLGTDVGLKQGHTLEVYRLKPQPTYLGRIQIVDAAKGQATGRLMAPARGKTPKIEVGDEVASSVR
jgi:hypothetical protein